jgi:ribose transport system permease protein
MSAAARIGMASSTGSGRAWAARVQRYSIFVILLIVSGIFANLSPIFLTTGNLTNVLQQASATAIAAVGMTFVIVFAEIDISIGSLISFAMTVGWMVAAGTGGQVGFGHGGQLAVSAWIYPVGLLMGIILGVGNGLLMNSLRINAFVATLSTMFAFRGIAWKLVGSDDKPFTVDSPALFLGRTYVWGVGLPVYLMIIVAVVAALVLNRTPVGRYLYAIGGSQRSAAETGLPINRIRLMAFGVSGLCAAIAGLITVARVGTLQASLGVGFEFTVISAVVLGGTSLMGGRGSIVGSILGAILLVVIDNGLNLINASVYIYDVVKGAILMIAVGIDVVVLTRFRD